MPHSFSIDMLPMGVSLNHAFEGESVTVRTKEFLSTEDGNTFVDRLNGVSECYRPLFVPVGPHLPSSVDNFLAIVTRNREVTAFCNELSFIAEIRKQPRPFKQGELVRVSDIVDIERLELRNASGEQIIIPTDCGLVLIFSVGWRKGIYYDYSVFGANAPTRTDDLARLLGRLFARVTFQEMYSISEEQWQRLTAWGWFPFISIAPEDRKRLIGWASQDRIPIPVLQEICERFKPSVLSRIDVWKSQQFLQPHADFLQEASDAYQAGKYIGSIQVLFPRIEGIMRGLHLLKTGEKPNQNTMVKTLVDQRDADSVLLPRRFQEYLLSFYFQGFDEQAGVVPLSRHSVAHGNSSAQDYDFLKATLGFLIVDQLYFYLGP